jgi:hypothetical protein
VALCVGFCAGPGSATASAQTTVIVAGVADANTGAPLEGAQIRLPDMGLIVRTNWIGEATINDVPRGTRRIQVRKLGYSPSDISLMVSGDSTGPVFMLAPAITTLDAVRIEAEWYPQRMEEFFTRRKMGIGRFLSDSALAKEGHRDIALVVSMRFPGLRAVLTPGGRYALMSTRHQAGSSGGMINMSCPVDIYLDGMFFGGGLEGLYPSDLGGIELYSMTSAPPQYRRSTGSCSVLLAWSKF